MLQLLPLLQISTSKIFGLLLGSTDVNTFIAACVAGFFGALLVWVLSIRKGLASSTTPAKLNFTFWIKDNWPRVLFTTLTALFTIVIFVRFWPQLSGYVLGAISPGTEIPIDTDSISVFTGFVIGLGHEKLSKLLEDKYGWFSQDREKIMAEAGLTPGIKKK